MAHWKQTKLEAGETFITSEKGNSMIPLIKSGQDHKLAPTKWEDCVPGDIVFCKVRQSYYTHLVTAKNDKEGLQISNNKSKVNGWTKKVYGKVIEVL
jgi:hypothetical protein